jgi:hypothetical protein
VPLPRGLVARKAPHWAAAACALFYLSVLPAASPSKPAKSAARLIESEGQGPAVLWHEPQDIANRNLFYGPGGESHRPQGPLTFVKEDREGTSPKFDAIDQAGTKWKLKMGVEARPETVASRFVWAVGYFADEDYFLPAVRVQQMPRLHRGEKYVTGGVDVANVRLKRNPDSAKKIGIWHWAHDPFSGSRELNGLRTLMAVINNWDLKDKNLAVVQLTGDRPEQRYLVSDLGASFGTTGYDWTAGHSKGNLKAYAHSKFIKRVMPETVSFYVPSREIPLGVTLGRTWIGRNIPIADARWMGDLLGRLSPKQIRDAFRAAQYSDHDVEAFSRVVEERIAALRSL